VEGLARLKGPAIGRKGDGRKAEAYNRMNVGPPLAVRVGNSRISLDLIVEQYENGMMPEEMIRAYDTLVLADVIRSSPITYGTAMKCGLI
jgi:hypothetical protein